MPTLVLWEETTCLGLGPPWLHLPGSFSVLSHVPRRARPAEQPLLQAGGPGRGSWPAKSYPHCARQNSLFMAVRETQVYTERRTDLDNRVLGSSGFNHCCLPASAVRFSALPLWKGCPPYHRVTYFKRKTHYPRGRRTLSLPQTACWYGWPLNNARLRGASFSTVANARIACSGPSGSAVSHPQSQPATGCVVVYHLLLENSPV